MACLHTEETWLTLQSSSEGVFALMARHKFVSVGTGVPVSRARIDKQCSILQTINPSSYFTTDKKEWRAGGFLSEQDYIPSLLRWDKARNFLVLTLISSLIKILERAPSFHPVNGVKCSAHH